jgi:hypothetical protein
VDIICIPEEIPQVSALVDFGATSSFIDQTFVTRHKIPMVKKSAHVPVEVIDGRTIASGAITPETTPLELCIGNDCSQHHLNPSPFCHPWSILTRSAQPYHRFAIQNPHFQHTTVHLSRTPSPKKTPCQVLPRTL